VCSAERCARSLSGPARAPRSRPRRACPGCSRWRSRTALWPSTRRATSSARISVGKKSPRALTPEETSTLTGWLHANQRAGSLDIPDLVDWMLATGCRIGEALALRHGPNTDGKPLLDLRASNWEVNATVVRVPRRGLIAQPRPKTAAGWRVGAVPDFAVSMVRARAAGGTVSCSPLTEHSRLDRGDRCAEGQWSWVTSHVFRKTVATRLDEAGFTPRQVANQHGHANPR
jgi:integrase